MSAPIEARTAITSPRAAAVAGIVFSVLLAVAIALFRNAAPSDPNAAGDWLADGGRRNAVVVALNLLPFASIAFLWFIGVVRDRIGEGEDRLFTTVFLGSGLLFVAMMLTAAAIAGGLLFTAEDNAVAASQPAIWAFGRRIVTTILNVYAMRMAAVFTMATTTLAVRLRLIPRWLAVVGYLTAAALLLTVGVVPWLELLFPAWVFVFSVHILVVTLRAPQLPHRQNAAGSRVPPDQAAPLMPPDRSDARPTPPPRRSRRLVRSGSEGVNRACDAPVPGLDTQIGQGRTRQRRWSTRLPWITTSGSSNRCCPWTDPK